MELVSTVNGERGASCRANSCAEHDRGAVTDQRRRERRDSGLGVTRGSTSAVWPRLEDESVREERTAVRPLNQPSPLKRDQISAHGHLGRIDCPCQIMQRNDLVRPDELADEVPALGTEHGWAGRRCAHPEHDGVAELPAGQQRSAMASIQQSTTFQGGDVTSHSYLGGVHGDRQLADRHCALGADKFQNQLATLGAEHVLKTPLPDADVSGGCG